MRVQIVIDRPKAASFALHLGLSSVLFALLSVFLLRGQEMNKQPPQQMTSEEECLSNLKTIYRLLKLYLHQSAGTMGFPSDFKYIYGMSHEPKDFVCPGDKEIDPSAQELARRVSYEFVNNPLKPNLSATPPRRIAIVAEKRPNHNGRRFVLFYDGSVRAFDQPAFDKLKKNSFMDEEPTPKP